MPGAKTRSGLIVGVRERGLELGAQDPREEAHLAHRDGDRRDHRLLGDPEDVHGIAQRRGERGDLDHVGVQLVALLGDVGEVLGGLLEVVIADDALGAAELADLLGDVHLDVDVIDPQRDRLAQQPLPLLLVPAPEPPVRRPAQR